MRFVRPADSSATASTGFFVRRTFPDGSVCERVCVCACACVCVCVCVCYMQFYLLRVVDRVDRVGPVPIVTPSLDGEVNEAGRAGRDHQPAFGVAALVMKWRARWPCTCFLILELEECSRGQHSVSERKKKERKLFRNK